MHAKGICSLLGSSGTRRSGYLLIPTATAVILALLFLLEAWLWDHLEPIVARVVNFIPWGRVTEYCFFS